MRSSRLILIAAFLAGGLFTCPAARAAEGIRVTIEGAKQGHFKGDVSGRGKDKITGLKYSHEVTSPRDLARPALQRARLALRIDGQFGLLTDAHRRLDRRLPFEY